MYIHSFPDGKKNAEMYAKWVENVNKNALVKFVPTEATRICSEHFRSDMKEEVGQKVILNPRVYILRISSDPRISSGNRKK